MLRRLLILVLFFVSPYCAAEEVNDLYSAMVPIADQSSSAREQGVLDALQNVLIKLTGNSQTFQSTRLAPFLSNANGYVDALSFEDLPLDLNAKDYLSDSPGFGLRVKFSRSAIDLLIRQAQLPILPSNRPKFLVWIIRDDPTAGRGFIGEDVAAESTIDSVDAVFLTRFDRAMRSRGIPYILPTFDLEDQLVLPIEQAWNLKADDLALASQRYQTDGWIALRFYRTSTGEVRGSWLYQAGGRRQLNDFRSEGDEHFLEMAVDNLLDRMTRSFSYIPRSDTNKLLLEIYNVNSYSAYQSVLKQLKKLEVIDSVDLFSTRGNQLIMSVEAEGGQELLRNALVRSGRFHDWNAGIEIENQQLTFDWIK
ncbi:MAG: DUF2066 domain-containing protein [Porticoccaceae bacterium]|nr:DUF2066 domain-containing protein [Porticoccaceae bacterium]MBT6421545.1 DUF2066 domain-containing protein [Porticoccaceae bacterium]MBT6693329.1 DUF2066 domain-containing protein [Porticoccaceae bacterium]MBT7752650.1 DUF2066 domain-containing protein [Porticoccaceae bacterium]MBT7963128.1 DUF2066 domain-containing protein [Porticoccaceae bacterium]